MKGICRIWSRGRLISPSLPVGDDWYLNLNSQKRPPGRNLGEHRLVRRSGTASRGTVLFSFCLRMRTCPKAEALTIFWGKQYWLFQKFKTSHHSQNLFQCEKRNTYKIKLRPLFSSFGSWSGIAPVRSSCESYKISKITKMAIPLKFDHRAFEKDSSATNAALKSSTLARGRLFTKVSTL